MAKCELTEGCPFFNSWVSQNMPSVVEGMKERYCLGDNRQCARFRVFKARGREQVPQDLTPADTKRADQIIKAA